VDGTLVYSKTPRGIAEISLRSAKLSMTTRRVLIMLDGKRTVDDLSMLAKASDIESAISALETGGLIQRVAFQGNLDVPTINGRESEGGLNTTGVLDERDANPVTLEEVKRRAVRALHDRLGPEADAISMRIEECRTIEDFRNCVREAERLVSAALGAAAAQEYLKSLRRRS